MEKPPERRTVIKTAPNTERKYPKEELSQMDVVVQLPARYGFVTGEEIKLKDKLKKMSPIKKLDSSPTLKRSIASLRSRKYIKKAKSHRSVSRKRKKKVMKIRKRVIKDLRC